MEGYNHLVLAGLHERQSLIAWLLCSICPHPITGLRCVLESRQGPPRLGDASTFSFVGCICHRYPAPRCCLFAAWIQGEGGHNDIEETRDRDYWSGPHCFFMPDCSPAAALLLLM